MKNLINIAETIRIKFRKLYINKTSKYRINKIYNKNFTIISNNCWGGFIYQSYNLKYNTPTVGLFFMADDYIKFIKNLKKYLNIELKFIKPEDSKWRKELESNKKFGKYPIGILNDIEIHFLHYKNELEAKEKWTRRSKRINWENIIYKFSNQNLCNEKHLKEFIELPLKNKICFVNKKYDIKELIYVKQIFKTEDILASYEPFGHSNYIDINKFINELKR